MQAIRNMIDDFGGSEMCTLIGVGKTTPVRADFYNSGLIRYYDFNDSYLAKGETCYPSDNIGSILTSGETTGLIGKEFLTALVIAYHVQCRLSDEAPVPDKGFDHTTQGSNAVAAGVSKALKLDEEKTAHAIHRVRRILECFFWIGKNHSTSVFGSPNYSVSIFSSSHSRIPS